MLDDLATKIAEAKGAASANPVKVPEMRDLLEKIASDEQAFIERSVDFWGCSPPTPEKMRRVVVLEACIRFLQLCEQNADGVRKALKEKK